MSSNWHGSQLMWCSQCGANFTITNWRLHTHNPLQAQCDAHSCRRRATGYWFAGGVLRLQCGEHLLAARRSGHEVTIVDGSVCPLCDGRGEVEPQGVDAETPGGRWSRCTHCLGSGYDADIKLPASNPRRVVRKPPFSNRNASPPSGPRLSDEDQEWLREVLEERSPGQEERAQPEESSSAPPPEKRSGGNQRIRAGAPTAGKRPASARPAAARPSARNRGPRRPMRRGPRRGVAPKVVRALPSSALAVLAGAAVGVLFIFPLLPDAAAEQVVDLQALVRELFDAGPGGMP